MTTFISHIHKDLRGTRLSHRGATHKAEDVPKGLHKEYLRMERISLPEPRKLTMTLSDALESRRSAWGGSAEGELSLERCSALFGSALRRRGASEHRNYPSGGALFPIETYLLSQNLETQTPGVFHYHPTAHALERLWSLPEAFDLKTLAQHPESLIFSSLIIFTSVWKRSSAKYGDFTYTLALLEAGHMSENTVLAGGALGLATRPMAGFNDGAIIELLDLDPEHEQPVHTVTLSIPHA